MPVHCSAEYRLFVLRFYAAAVAALMADMVEAEVSRRPPRSLQLASRQRL